MNQLIVDKDGLWYVNEGAFPFIDPTNNVRFEPQVWVKVKTTPWIKSQFEVIKERPDPNADAKPAEPVKVTKK